MLLPWYQPQLWKVIQTENPLVLICGGEKRHYTDDLTVNVSGLGVNGTKYHNNVTGIYALDGTQVAIDKNVTVTVKNPAPAESGAKT